MLLGGGHRCSEQVRPQFFSRDACDAFDFDHPFGGHPLPLHDRSACKPQAMSDLGGQSTLRSDEGHSIGHNSRLPLVSEVCNLGKLDCFPSTPLASGKLPPMTIGDRIRSARLAAGLSQRDLANAIGVSHGIVGQWETDRKAPGIESLRKIAAVTFTDPSSLLSDIPATSGILVQDARQLTMLRRFVQLSPRQQQNLLELLGVAADVRRELQEPSHPANACFSAGERGKSTPR